ncbi:MAG: DUF6958 family protein, partial [Burkholderiales bacterium]
HNSERSGLSISPHPVRLESDDARRRQGVSAVTRSRTEVENPNHPGRVRSVDADRYAAMKRAYLTVLPKTPPGLTLAEIRDRLIAHLPEDLFPGGAKAGWWAKTVQLDLEAKGVIARAKTRPLRLRRI